MKHAIGLPASGLFTSRALARAVAGCFDATRLRSATLASALALGIVASAQAATITVTNTNATGPGSLAWAWQQSRSNASTTDVIVIESSVSGVIDITSLPESHFVTYDVLTLRGPGSDRVTIKSDARHALDPEPYGSLAVEGVTLRNVALAGSSSSGVNSAVRLRDSVVIGTTISGRHVVVENSQLLDTDISTRLFSSASDVRVVNSSIVNGSVIAGSSIEIVDSSITGNPDAVGSTVNSRGMVVFYSTVGPKTVIVRNSVIAGGARAGFVATCVEHVSMLIENSVIANNQGHGIELDADTCDYEYSGVLDFALTINNSTISGNGGRGLHAKSGDFVDFYANGHVDTTAVSMLRVDNSTFSGNGGGIEIVLGNGGRLASSSIKRSTIAGNAADHGGGVSVVRQSNGTIVGPASSLTFDSALIAKNTASVAGADLFTDVSGFTFKADYSLIQNPAGAPITSTVAGSNITGQDPKLMRLANLGGTTSVRALGAGSPALNKGNPSLANVPPTDQRGTGFPRVAGGRIDIGAFEQQSVDVAPVVLRSLPDVTGNGTPELAALVQSIPTGATTVRVRDALTGAAHWQVTLPGAGEAIDLETLGDVNGNGKRDIAVLRTAPASVAIRDGLTGAAVKTIALASGFFPKALATLTDVNGNGKPEVAVLGTKAGKSVVELRDSQTGALIKSTTFNSPGTPRDVVALRQQAGNASSPALLGVLMDVRDPTQSDALEIRNALTGALVTRGDVGFGAESMEVAVLPDSNGNSANEFAVLKSSGTVRVFDLPGFAPMTTMQFLAGDVPLHLTTVPDANGSGVTELAVLSRRNADGALKAEVRDAATGAIVSTMNYSSQYRADELVSMSDINNNGIAELSHVGPNSSGVVRATQRDVATGVLSSRVNVLP